MFTFSQKAIRLAGAPVFGLAIALALGSCAPPQSSPEKPLSVDDVSWLFPPPKSTVDLSRLIAIKDLTIADPKNPANRLPAWSDAAFNQFLAIADSQAAEVAGPSGARIGSPPAARTRDAWYVAGVRIDAGAPGLDPAILAAFGQRPQIRLILQPVVTGQDGTPRVLDTAAHLIFDFVLPEPAAKLAACPLHATPDLANFKGVVSDVAALRDQLEAGQFGGASVSTDGLPLGVHPGLANAATEPLVAQQMKALLEKNLVKAKLSSMALMGLPAGKDFPWIFVSMLRDPRTGQFGPVPGPTLDGHQVAMMLVPGSTLQVLPTPHTNNRTAITCMSAAFGPTASPIASRQGSSTSDVFSDPAPSDAKITSIGALIDDPTRSHFFNTDCVSCHTETRMAMKRLNLTSSPGLSTAVMPNSTYDVRNFGWAPPIKGVSQATVTRRAAAETAAVVNWVNANKLTQ